MNFESHRPLELQTDLMVLIRRDGQLLGTLGGDDLAGLKPSTHAMGQSLGSLWPSGVADAVVQCAKRAIAVRGASDSRFEFDDNRYEVRATARGPDRASCLIRRALHAADDTLNAKLSPSPRIERRGFLRRFRESMAVASLTQKAAAVAVIHIDSVADIAQSFDLNLSERIVSLALKRLDAVVSDASTDVPWYLGQLSNNVLVIVFESSSRETLSDCLEKICDNLRQPLQVGALTFHLNPFAGAAILGCDSGSARTLLNCARSAASEARRTQSGQPHFFSDTMRMKSLTRLDMARELQDAIANGDIQLRYTGRYDLITGDLDTCVAYLRWIHPLRGAVPPAEFLRIAATTGLAEDLSRTALQTLRRDFAQGSLRLPANVRVSFGGLKHHVLSASFVADIEHLLDSGSIPANRLELRIAERACLLRDPRNFKSLTDRGVQIVVDEAGRDAGALRRLANAPISGLQLDRALAAAIRTDATAHKLCRAIVGIATAFNLTPIATAVDDEQQRDDLLAMGCRLGQGDWFAAIAILPAGTAK